MNRLIKIAYFSILALITVVQWIQGNYLLAALLTVIVCFALPFYEKREAKRQFYRALRKLYVCVDLDAFIIEREKLVKNALFSRAIKIPLRILINIEAYYNGQRESVLNDLSRIPSNRVFQFWISSYMGMCDLSHIDTSFILGQLSKVPRFYRKIASERYETLKLIQMIQYDDRISTAEIEALRARVTSNLIIAELTLCLRDHTQNERLRNYYEKAATNLSKGLKI